MTKLCALLLVAFASLGQLDASAAQRRYGPVTVHLKGPVVLGFFPPFTKAEERADDGGISEGLAHLRFALEDIAKCYGDKAATYRLEITRSITLRDGKRLRRISIPRDWDHSVGIILAMPGRAPRTVFASGGPSALIELGPAAAAEYFRAPACRSEG